MAYSDTYIANHHDRLLRLADVWAAKQVAPGGRVEEAVKVASRRWEELVRQGYRVANPRPRPSINREMGLGIRKTIGMMVPGGAFINEAWDQEEREARRRQAKGNRRNPVEGLSFTTWAAVRLMQERAKEYGEPGMVGVVPESNASMAWDKAQTVETKMARVQAGVPRMALQVFGVVDRPRVYGYAPEKWVDEFSERVRETETRDQDARVEGSTKAAVKAWGTFVDEYNRIGRKYMEKLEAVVVKYENAAAVAIEDLRQGHGVPAPVKREVQSTGSGVLSKIGSAGTMAGSALMSLAKAVKVFVNIVTAVPEISPLPPELAKYADRPESGMRKRKGKR